MKNDIFIIQIRNWDKHNPSPSRGRSWWFKFDHNMFSDAKFVILDSDQKLIWIWLLSEASKSEKRGYVTFSHKLSRMYLPYDEKTLSRAFKIFKSLQLVNMRDVHGKYDACTRYVPHSTVQEITEDINLVHFANERVSDFSQSIDKIYQQYPRKFGKKNGIKKLVASIKTEEQLKKLEQALSRFLKHHSDKKTESQFIPHFSTWVSSWEDWLDIDAGKDVKAIAVADSSQVELENFKKQMEEHSKLYGLLP